MIWPVLELPKFENRPLERNTAYCVYSITVNYAEDRSEEHTSELQSLTNLVCRLLLEKKKKKKKEKKKKKKKEKKKKEKRRKKKKEKKKKERKKEKTEKETKKVSVKRQNELKE